MSYIIAGFLSGICTGLGLGGGSVLILILTLFFNMEQHLSQATNIICFTVSAIISILINIKNKNIDYKFAYKIIIFGVIGAIIGAYISSNINVSFLKKCFGIFLLFVGINELVSFYKMYIKNKKG